MNIFNNIKRSQSLILRWLFSLLMALKLVSSPVLANQDNVGVLPVELVNNLPTAELLGKGKLTFFGLDVYESSLWTGANFKSLGFENYNFALELQYLRNFSAADIAKRSIDEMQRIEPMPDQKATAWLKTLSEVFPNVKKGDRIMGIHKPGSGVVFWHNGKRSGEVRDAEFSRQFFAIWLSPKTSEPKLRFALLGKAN